MKRRDVSAILFPHNKKKKRKKKEKEKKKGKKRAKILTHINNRHIHPKRIRRKIRNIPHIITPITHGRNPMRHRRPNRHPSHKLGIQLPNALSLTNIIRRIIKQRNQTRHTDDRKRLSGKNGKYGGGESGCEETFVDAVEVVCAALHVQGEGDGGEEVDEEDADGAGESAVVEAVGEIA